MKGQNEMQPHLTQIRCFRLFQMFLSPPHPSPSVTCCRDADTTSMFTSFRIRDSPTLFWPPLRPQVEAASMFSTWHKCSMFVLNPTRLFHQLLTLLPSTRWTMWQRPPSGSAGPSLWLLLQVRPYLHLCNCVGIFLFFMEPSVTSKSSSARLPCGLHTIAGRQQHWARTAWVRNLRQPGWPETWSPLQHQYLRCEGGAGERADLFPGRHWRIPSARYTPGNWTEWNDFYTPAKILIYFSFTWSCSFSKLLLFSLISVKCIVTAEHSL